MGESTSQENSNRLPVFALEDLPPAPPHKRGWPWTEVSPALPETAPGGRPWPAIGILTPSYNQGRYLEETIRSVLLQGYPRLEYYLIDGGSTDETLKIVRKYERFLSGWVSEPDRGQAHAINKGMGRLNGAKWVTWLNSDDTFLEGALRAVGRWAGANADAVAVVGRGSKRIEGSRRLIATEPRPDFSAETLRRWRTHAFLQPSCFFSKAAFDQIGGVNEALYYALDFELWVKLGQIGRFDCIEDRLAQELLHPEAKTRINMGACYGEICEVLFRLGYADDARLLVEQIFSELDYVSGFVNPITDNRLYRRLLQPWVRRLWGPQHLKDPEVGSKD